MLELTHNNRLFTAETAQEMAEMDIPEGIVAQAVSEQEAQAARQAVRNEIAKNAGDTLAVLGTTSDGAQLVLFHLAEMATALSSADTLADVRAAAKPFADLTAQFLAKVETGEVKLPFQIKGENAVMSEIQTRATAVSNALQTTQTGD